MEWRWLCACVASAAIGLVGGWLVFHLPEAACGPLRSELAATWAAAIGGLVVAAATLWAVLVAIAGARQATNTALVIRNSEIDEEEAKMHSMRLRFSVIFRNELLLLGHQLARLALDLRSATSARDSGRAKVYLFDQVPKFGLTLLSRFSSDLYAFPPDVAGALALAFWRWNAIQERPDLDLDSDGKILKAAETFAKTLEIAVSNFQAAFSALEPYLPEGMEKNSIEQQFGKADERYVPGSM